MPLESPELNKQPAPDSSAQQSSPLEAPPDDTSSHTRLVGNFSSLQRLTGKAALNEGRLPWWSNTPKAITYSAITHLCLIETSMVSRTIIPSIIGAAVFARSERRSDS